MHLLFQKADELSRVVVGAAIEVHRLKGPGLIESIYERCLMRELEWADGLVRMILPGANGSHCADE